MHFAPGAYAQEILQKTDKFSGVTVYSTRRREADLEGGSFISGRYVSFDLHSFGGASLGHPFALGVPTTTGEWVFIRSGASIDLKLDGLDFIHLSGGGSQESRHVISGNVVMEDALYDLSADDLKKIAQAKTGEFRLYGDRQTITGTLPADFLKDAATMLASAPVQADAGGAAKQPLRLGIQFVALTPTAIAALHLNSDHGLIIVSVDPGSPAEKMGLKQADVILSLNGTPMREIGDLPRAASTADPAAALAIHIWRGGSELDISARL